MARIQSLIPNPPPKMSSTVIGPADQPFPSQAISALVEVKPSWSDEWKHIPELEFASASLATAAHDLGSCELVYRYGTVKDPWESAARNRKPLKLSGHWVRVSFLGNEGKKQAWIGRIEGQGRHVYGDNERSSGVQTFEAFSPRQILRKIHVGRSYWNVNDALVQIDWVPPLNEPRGRSGRPPLHEPRPGADHRSRLVAMERPARPDFDRG